MQPSSISRKRKSSQPPSVPIPEISSSIEVNGLQVADDISNHVSPHRPAKRPRLKVDPTLKNTSSRSWSRRSTPTRKRFPSVENFSAVPSSNSFANRTEDRPPPSLSSPTESVSVNPYNELVYTPTHLPPVNLNSLHEMDIEIILKNSQLRHDLLFDPNLQFRPSTSKRKLITVDRYWLALSQELDTGCVCTAWDANDSSVRTLCGTNGIQDTAAHTTLKSSRLQDFIGASTGPHCSVFSSTSWTSSDPPLCTTRLPSRLSTMLYTFFRALHAILAPMPPPGTPSPPPRPSYLAAVAEADHLVSQFDLKLMEQEIRRGIFECEGVVQTIGSVLKKHCAPIRDGKLDAMIEVARRKGIAIGAEGARDRNKRMIGSFRMCFEIMELMKLDIANHQLQHLRSLIIQSTPDYELRLFLDNVRRGSMGVEVTKDWLISAERSSKRASASSNASVSFGATAETTSLPDPTPDSKEMQDIRKTLIEAFTTLIFNPPASNAFGRSLTSTTSTLSEAHTGGQGSGQSQVLDALPETLYLDSTRLNILVSDAADLTSTYMLLLLWRSMVFSPSMFGPDIEEDSSQATPRKKQVKRWEVERLKQEVSEVGPGSGRLGKCLLNGAWGGFADLKDSDEAVKDEKDEEARMRRLKTYWQDRMENIILQGVVRAEEVRSPSPSINSFSRRGSNPYLTPTSPSRLHGVPLPASSSLSLMRGWIRTNLQSESALSQRMKEVLRKEVARAVGVILEGRKPSILLDNVGKTPLPVHPSLVTPVNVSFPPMASDLFKKQNGGTGLEPLTQEIAVLAARLAKLIGIHEKIYGGLYVAEAFWTA